MYLAILGRQSALGLAELERVYGQVERFSATSALLPAAPDIMRLGGTLKTGRVILTFPRGDWRSLHTKITQHYYAQWRHVDHKLTLGISVYGLPVTAREIQRTGLALKKQLKSDGVSLRLIPNQAAELNTATSHHNKLGLSAHKVELLVVRGARGDIVVAESTGAQHISAIARRDQGRPKRDAFVGMLPPKLALMMVNLGAGNMAQTAATPPTLLDPFCGTGVVLQEAALLGYNVYGTDLSEKMIGYSQQNLVWLSTTFNRDITSRLAAADAMTAHWQPPIDTVVCEAYLGQPFSAPPSPAKLREVRGNCNHIIGSFLSNLAPQLAPGTPLCVAVPAWRSQTGSLTHLPLINNLETYGFAPLALASVQPRDLIYYRDDQVVARELLVISKQ